MTLKYCLAVPTTHTQQPNAIVRSLTCSAGVGVFRPSRQMQRWTPVLKASIIVLKLAAAVTRVVTGLPIPIGVDEMTEGMAFAVLAGA